MSRTADVARAAIVATLAAMAPIGLPTAGDAAEPQAFTFQARAYRPGELVVLNMSTSSAPSDIHVHAFGRAIPVFRSGPDMCRALIGIDLDVRAGKQKVVIDLPDGRHVAKGLTVRNRRFPSRRLRVDPDFVTPPADVLDRVEREAHELSEIWKLSSPDPLWTTGFVRPVTENATSSFGTRSIFNGQRRNPHNGADFPSPAGAPVRAPNAGRIVLARELYFSGNTVIIDHGLGVFSTLAHLSEFETREGEGVVAGQVVGLVGATGRVTGPHLHWAVRVAGARVDPLSVLELLR